MTASGSTPRAVWDQVVALAGSDFTTKTGRVFRYDIVGNSVALRNTNRMIPRSHIERAMDRSPLSGPGQLQDLQGPSYVYAIVVDPRLRGVGDLAPELQESSDAASHELERKVRETSTDLTHKHGRAVSRHDLEVLGFKAFELHFHSGPIQLPHGDGTDWDTIGTVPSGPGLYAFTTEIQDDPGSLRVRYVGMTTDLWMVTKGQLPGGTARGGQRYGRPKHAGETRKRVNLEVTRARAEGLHVRHWLRACQISDGVDIRASLLKEEGRLITLWQLRREGWNRG